MKYVRLVENTLEESAKDTAKAVRTALKKAFPKQKFSVTSSRGSAVRIKYKGGPSEKEVKEVVYDFESIDRDQATGEILGGGNTYIFVTREDG